MAGIIKLPVLTDKDGNAVGENKFLCQVIDAYKARQKHNIELTSEYEALCKEIKERSAGIENAQDANDFVEWVKGLTHIMNSKAVALAELSAKASDLSLHYNKQKGIYEL